MTAPTDAPIAAEVWRAVMAAADYHCQCQGACGRTHRDGQCQRGHRPGAPLIAAPHHPDGRFADPPADQMTAWCAGCFDGAARAARRALADRPPQAEALFGGDLP